MNVSFFSVNLFTVAHASEVVLVRLLELLQRVVGSLVVREIHFFAFRNAEGGQGPSSLSVLVKNHTVPKTYPENQLDPSRNLYNDHLWCGPGVSHSGGKNATNPKRKE